MRLKHIEVFNAVMLTGTVSGAARLLHVTQPAITQTLQHAELQLGYALFSRHRQRLVPTSEAQSLYPEIQKVISHLESARRLANALRGTAHSQLRVMIVPSLSVRHLPEALQRFRKLHPQVRVSIRTLHSTEIAQAIALREADVGIIYGPAPHPALREEIVAHGRLVCVTRATPGLKDNRASVALRDLADSPFICIDERDPIGAILAEQWARIGIEPRGDITVQTYHTAMVLALQGFGPAIIDSFTAVAGGAEKLHVRSLLPEVPVTVRAVMPQDVSIPPPVVDFVEALRAATADER